jgi:pimeloyl-ACP methyl ester carboxylesterase
MTPTWIQATAGLVAVLAGLGARADALANPLEQAPSSFALVDDIRVHYKSLGAGEQALVFVHGWTCDLTSWKYQVPAFVGKVRVIVIDLPGHGKSDKPQTDYTMDLFARAVNAVLANAGVGQAILVGHSMGTPVVRQFYRLFPKKTLALVAVDGSLQRFPMTAGQVEQFLRRYQGADWRANYDKVIQSMMNERTPANVRSDLQQALPAAPQHVVVGAMKGMFDPSVWKDDAVAVPLLVVMAKSPRWSAPYEAYVRKLAPQADYRLMEGVGHFLMMEEPEEFNDVLARFLRAQGFLKE